MKKKVIVMSLGGSLIIPDKVNYKLLEKFKIVLRKFYKTHKFVIVCGGGAIARAYISALQEEHKSQYEISQAGIRATRMNAMFLMQFFGKKDANDTLPRNMEEVKANLHDNNVVICGALRWVPHSTSDSTAAKLASFLKTDFINLTNIKGLYTSNPLINKSAKFIPKDDWKTFEKRAHALGFKAGQHFVLDQKASTIIRQHKIKTYILGDNMNNLKNYLAGKSFIGTTISG